MSVDKILSFIEREWVGENIIEFWERVCDIGFGY